MKYTSIGVSPQLKEQLQEYGKKGQTYEEIISELLHKAQENEINSILGTVESVPIDEAIKRAEKKYGEG